MAKSFNLSHLMDKKNFDVMFGDKSFKCTVTARVLDEINNQDVAFAKQILKGKKLHARNMKKGMSEQQLTEKMLNNLDFEIANMIEGNTKNHASVVSFLMGNEQYSDYVNFIDKFDGLTVEIANKAIYELALSNIKTDEEKETKNE